MKYKKEKEKKGRENGGKKEEGTKVFEGQLTTKLAMLVRRF